jgi:hypothetical protein
MVVTTAQRFNGEQVQPNRQSWDNHPWVGQAGQQPPLLDEDPPAKNHLSGAASRGCLLSSYSQMRFGELRARNEEGTGNHRKSACSQDSLFVVSKPHFSFGKVNHSVLNCAANLSSSAHFELTCG